MLDPFAAEFWVLLSFLIFFGILFYYGVPKMLANALDARAEQIRAELDDARRLREEAQQLLSDYQRRAREAGEEAKIIIEQARHEAETLAAETRKSLAETLERRTKIAEEKIARAEAQALGDVRASAVDAAMAAAERIIKAKVQGATSDRLIGEALRDLKGKLN